MKKTYILFSLLFLSIMLIGCDAFSTTSTTNVSSDTTSTSTLSININDEDNYTSNITTDEVVTFSVSGIDILSGQASLDGTTVLIDQEGTYLLEGTSSNTSIVIDVANSETVTLVLNNVDLTNPVGALINVVNADKVIISLTEDSVNKLTDSSSLGTQAVIDSNDDVTINGYGTLLLKSSGHNGINVDDDLVITGGTIDIEASNNGINVNNDFTVSNCNLIITSGNDGIKVENLDDDLVGNVLIQDGVFSINAYGDGIASSNVVAIFGGTFTIDSGVNNNSITTKSGKGIKATKGINIMGGMFTITSADDSLHANSDFYIQDGTLVLSSNDDGIHADDTLTISGGSITILKSYEGIESSNVTISGGSVKIKSSDDGINCAGGVDSSNNFFTPGGQIEDALLLITGGYLYVNSSGDGLDSNGDIEMTGGVVVVSGPTLSNNGATDYNGTFTLSGGLLIAVGSSGMAENVSSSTNQATVLINLTASTNALLHIEDEDGDTIIDFQPEKTYQSIVISSPDLKTGSSYKLYLGGSTTELNTEGFGQNGNYSYGTLNQTFTITSSITTIGTQFSPRR